MGLREIKKQLNKMDKNVLVNHISEMYKKYKPVKEYIEFNLNPIEPDILSKYKKNIRECFYPIRGMQFKFSLAKQLLKDYKKLNPSITSLADLLLYFVECGIEFTNDFGDIDEDFYTSLENVYDSALNLCPKIKDIESLKKRALKIVDESSNIGWGFNNGIIDIYYSYFK